MARVVGLIPARAGSKRVPGKNMRSFRGLPLVAWTIKAAQRAALERVVLSTDNQDWRFELAYHYGVDWEDRDTSLAQDDTPSESVVTDFLGRNFGCEWLVLLQPTSPMRIARDIDACLHLAYTHRDGKATSYNSATLQRNGAVYVVNRDAFLEKPEFGGAYYFMPPERSLDIDTEEDFLK